MFSWKKKQPVEAPRPYYPAEPPRPILKTQRANTHDGAQDSHSGIRFSSRSSSNSVSPASTAPRLPTGLGFGVYQPGQPLFQREVPKIFLQIHPPAPSPSSQGRIPSPTSAQSSSSISSVTMPAPVARHRQSWESSGPSSPARSASINRVVSSSSPRRSSRPSSPSCSSFGARVRTESAPASIPTQQSVSMARRPTSMAAVQSFSDSNDTISTSPMPSHVTTPPTAYVSAMQTRQPPPPSPYRPTTTHERHRSLTRVLPEQLPMTQEMAPRPPRQSSLFQFQNQQLQQSRSADNRSSVYTLPGSIIPVPMLNIIPATPQESYEEFGGAGAGAGAMMPKRGRLSGALEEACQFGATGSSASEMVEVSLEEEEEAMVSSSSTELPKIPSPTIDITLDFSPFNPDVNLPMSDSEDGDGEDTEMDYDSELEHKEEQDQRPSQMREEVSQPAGVDTAPSEPLPPSPPFESYPSLPSLSSHASMPTSLSEDSMPSSSSSSSLTSFPDVEEALGSMLASLSDSNMSHSSSTGVEQTISEATVQKSSYVHELPLGNPGLGLGLDISASASFTAPLSPRKKAQSQARTQIQPYEQRPRPPPIDVELARTAPPAGNERQSAPPRINHRIAFYGTAKIHPRSPTSGIFTQLHMEENWYAGPSSAMDSSSSSVPNFQSDDNVPLERERNGHRHSQSFSIENDHSGHGSSVSFGDSDSDSHSTACALGLFGAGAGAGSIYGSGSRDSISLASEASDDDLHTASIISLTPVMGRKLVEVGMSLGMSEEMVVDEVGLAL